MKSFWNERYGEPALAYGSKPNAFIKSFLDQHSPGSILFPAEGQGRNAIYAAKKGWSVDAFDFSEVAKASALSQALNAGVTINYWIDDMENFKGVHEVYDVVGLCYVHLSQPVRVAFYNSLITSLKEGGLLVMEAFTKTQLAHESGGPKSEELLYTQQIVEKDFEKLQTIFSQELYTDLEEGSYHQGQAHIIRYIGRKGK
ncbi:MAG: class I SAM-dependent methyltransferase [Saprospiraceae bacterium]|nr:class I SAM-dependent methyltransferase [Saprospiraceae bacterium]